ncbi:sister chromatid cohesion protein [Rhizoctonia solani]|uniref:Sister chromatid cohesion protein n=1 Tax=Rhizoctonia solani TaxID=456999 RepID=A0A8H8P338_9AGAM|nr:sister chromatid cohesion protein [Rhizoctonia solani]QRW23437.1 sister chromatid cohesion protein [Rhizoctonia solani]
MVATTRGANSPRKLKFSDKIITKGLTTDALVKRMKTLHSELASIDQDNVDTNTLQGVRKELISTTILLHKDKGVRALAACCIADLLRLYAPDAPYTAPELKDIFQFFFRQLSTGLRGPDAPYYNEYFYLLESLASIKSIVLVCDIPAADELLCTIFRNVFDLVPMGLPKNVEMFMAEILVALIDECASLPSEVLEILLAQFLPARTRTDSPAYRLSIGVCTRTADKLQRHVAQYFGDLLLQHTPDDQTSMPAEDVEELRTAHELVQRLAQAVAPLLLNVVPQLEEELRVTDQTIRSIATQTLGAIFGDSNGAKLARTYPSTWTQWLLRRNDRVAVVRVIFVECAKDIVSRHAELKCDMEEALKGKFMDPDDKVRAAVCKLFSQIDYEAALHHVTKSQLEELAGRCLDRKPVVRHEAFNSIGRLYSLAYPEIENNDLAAVPQFSWIPGKLIEAAAMPETRDEAEKCISEFVLPMPTKSEDVVSWTERLLLVMKYLNPGHITSLLALANLKSPRPSVFERFIQCCVDFNVIELLPNNGFVAQSADASKLADDLRTFAKLNESRLYKLLKTCVDPQTDLKALIKSTSEFHRRVEQASSGILETMSWFLRRASLHIVNQSSIPTLVKKLKLSDQPNTESQSLVGMGGDEGNELIKALADEKHPRLVQCCTQALAAVVRTDNSLAPTEKRTTDRLVKIAQCDSPKQAKFALRALSYCKDGADLCAKVVKNIASTLPKAKGDTLVAHIAALAEAAKACPEAFEDKSNVITTYLVQELLMSNIPSTEDEMLTDDADEEWVEDNQLNAIGKAKLLALKVMHNRCLAHVNSDAALDVSQPVFKLLFAILEHGGAVNPSIDYEVKARLRLQAAVSLLKMSSAETYGNVVLKNLIMLAVTLQDTSFRSGKSEKELATGSLHRCAGSQSAKLRVQHFDMLFIRLLHLLAHHPDFTVTTEGLQDMAKYIEFYLDIVATAENISLQFHLALKAKTVRDADSHVFSEHLYVLSELAQHLIRARAKNRGWTLNTYPGKVKIPGDIFRALPNHEAASKACISKKEYLPEENLQWLSSAGKPIRSPTSKTTRTKLLGSARQLPQGEQMEQLTRRPKKTNTWREQSADEESDEDLTSESDEDQDNVKTQHHANTTSTREERRLRRSRGGEELEPKQDSEQSGEEEGSGEEESGRESGRESDGETEEEVDQGGDKDKSVGVARKKRRMRGPRLTHRKRRASRPSKP